MTAITLTGLRADNPLAFLAALGTLRVLTLSRPDDPPRMGWTMHAGAWRPVLECADSALADRAALVALLQRTLESHCHAEPFSFADNTCTKPDVFRAFVHSAAQDCTSADRRNADYAAAFGCECLTDNQGRVADTALRTMSGAGHQHFLKFMTQLCESTGPAHLDEALFGPWCWQDPPPSMRWDPLDDRRYALRWRNPTRDKITTVRGANRLAIEALPLFTTAPVGGSLETVAFSGKQWTWPVWSCSLPLQVVASTLALPELQQRPLQWPTLHARGIDAVFCSTRLTIGQYRNFSPARFVE